MVELKEASQKCEYCGKKLLVIGNDWNNRRFHKSCNKKRNEELDLKYSLEKKFGIKCNLGK